MAGKILVYTFYTPRCISNKILQKINIPNVQKFYLGKFEDLASILIKEKFDYVLGLGNFRKSAKLIRVETVYRNWYGKKKILETGPEFYEATWKLPASEGVVLSVSMTNGPCNRSAYKTCRAIEENNLQTKLAFVHVPLGMEIEMVRERVERWLINI